MTFEDWFIIFEEDLYINYNEILDFSTKLMIEAAFKAGTVSKQQEIERLKAELVTTEAELAQVIAIAEVYQDEMLKND